MGHMRIEDAGHQQDNAMVNDAGDWFYADNPDDAIYFAALHGARPANPDRWPWPGRWWNDGGGPASTPG